VGSALGALEGKTVTRVPVAPFASAAVFSKAVAEDGTGGAVVSTWSRPGPVRVYTVLQVVNPNGPDARVVLRDAHTIDNSTMIPGPHDGTFSMPWAAFQSRMEYAIMTGSL
jgi:hypothetical protein